MKKLIFFLVVGSIISAQPQALRRPFSPKEIPNSQDIQRMVHDQAMNRSTNSLYDQSGRPTKEVWQMWNGTAWKNDMMFEYEYAPGKIKTGEFIDILFIYYYIWLSGAWSPNGHEEYSYDNEGNLTEIVLYGDPYNRVTYTGPFTNGQPAVTLFQDYTNGGWVNIQRETETYDNNGCIIDVVIQTWNGSAWMFDWRVQNYYSQACCPERWFGHIGVTTRG